jgi:hypothetical protein
MLVVKLATAVAWQWYVLIGAVVTFGAAWVASGWLDRLPARRAGAAE